MEEIPWSLHEGRVGMGTTSDVATWVAGASLGTMPDEVVERARAGIVGVTRALARLGALEREPDVRGLVADLTPAVAAAAR
jgi:hypothetical protein